MAARRSPRLAALSHGQHDSPAGPQARAERNGNRHASRRPEGNAALAKQPALVALAHDLNLFDGHVPQEQWLFFLTTSLLFVPAAIVTWPTFLDWQLWDSSRAAWQVSPWLATFGSAPLSLLHWADYQPHGPRQIADVSLAGVLMLTVACEVVVVLSAPDAPLSERLFAVALAVVAAVICELDVFHARHSGGRTTHVTGTNLHMALRVTLFHTGLYGVGHPRGVAPGGGVVRAHIQLILFSVFTLIVHKILCDALWHWWRLHERKPQRPSLREHAFGLVISTAFISVYAIGMAYAA